MATTFICAHCGKEFAKSPRCKVQHYCSDRACQGARKQSWRRHKKQLDPEYSAAQRLSQRKWLNQCPGYWRQYRAAHPDKVEVNRQRQRLRDRRHSSEGRPAASADLAKSDAVELVGQNKKEIMSVISGGGEYWLIPIAAAPDLAKSDALKVKIEVLP